MCDFLRQRHKLGLDLAKEVLTNYLRRPDRQIAARLVEYASQLGLGQYTLMIWLSGLLFLR